MKGEHDDPRIVLIGVDIEQALFFEVDKPQPVVLYEMLKGRLKGEMPDLGRMHQVRGDGIG